MELARPKARDTEPGPPRREGVVPPGGRREAPQGVVSMTILAGNHQQALDFLGIVAHVADVPAADQPHDAGHHQAEHRDGAESRQSELGGQRIEGAQRQDAGLLVEVLHGNRRSEEHTSELQSPCNLVCRLLLEKKKIPILLLPGVLGRIFQDFSLTIIVAILTSCLVSLSLDPDKCSRILVQSTTVQTTTIMVT